MINKNSDENEVKTDRRFSTGLAVVFVTLAVFMNASGTSCPPGHSKAFCNAYIAAAGSSANNNNNQRSSSTQQVNTAHCDRSGYPSCYSLGHADEQNHPGTSCPSGHSATYCAGWN